MKTTQFERYFQNYLQKETAKEVQFSSLNREEKIEFLMNQLNDIDFSKMNIQTEKEVEIAKLSKDLRFELIEKAAKQGDLELIKNLSLNQGVANVIISQPFEKCSISAQLANSVPLSQVMVLTSSDGNSDSVCIIVFAIVAAFRSGIFTAI